MNPLALKLSQIEKSFGAKDVLAIDLLTTYQNDRIGIVGENGVGKSTLLKIIQGEILPDKGKVQKEIDFNYFAQKEVVKEGTTSELDGGLLSRFSVPKNEIETLSGGEETKYRLVKILSTYQLGLLLDEPTTHLDQESVEVLVEELRYYYGTLVFVSHNRYFLNQLATKIWEVRDGKVREYLGNYDEYKKQKKMEILENQREVAAFQKEEDRLKKAIEEKKKQAQKAQQISAKQKQKNVRPDRLSSSKQKDTIEKNLNRGAKAMESRLNQLMEVKKLEEERKIIFPVPKSFEIFNKFPIRGELLTLKRGDKILLEKVDFQFPLGKKIAITGKNGVGKTSFLQSILQKEKGIVLSPKVVFSTYRQKDYLINSEESILEYAKKKTTYQEAFIRSLMHNLGFTQQELTKKISSVSGGEATKVQLALFLLQPSNILVLDEPTNFIDLPTIEALEGILKNYPGTVLFTSHDPYFVSHVADVVFKIEGAKLIEVVD